MSPNLPMIRRVRQILTNAPGTRTVGDSTSGVRVSCGSDSTLSWVCNALDTAEIFYVVNGPRCVLITGSRFAA